MFWRMGLYHYEVPDLQMISSEQAYASYFITTTTLPVNSFDLVHRSVVRSTRLIEDTNGMHKKMHSDEERRPGSSVWDSCSAT